MKYKPRGISHHADKYLSDVWANFVGWQAFMKTSGMLFVQARLDADILATEGIGAVSDLEENQESLKMLLRAKNNFADMMFCRIMDDFEYYLVAICMDIFMRKPELLRSRDDDKNNTDVNFSLNDVIDNSASLESIISMLVSRKIDQVKRNQGGYEGLVRFIEKKFNGGKNILNKGDYALLSKYYALRNLFTHSGGVVDRQFAKKLPDFEDKIGQSYDLMEDNVMDARSKMMLIIIQIDMKLTSFFKDEELIDKTYSVGLAEGSSLIGFSERMENKVEILLKADRKYSKLAPLDSDMPTE